MKQQNRYIPNWDQTWDFVPDDEIEYCNAKTFFEQMDACNAGMQKALDEINAFGEGAL